MSSSRTLHLETSAGLSASLFRDRTAHFPKLSADLGFARVSSDPQDQRREARLREPTLPLRLGLNNWLRRKPPFRDLPWGREKSTICVYNLGEETAEGKKNEVGGGVAG